MTAGTVPGLEPSVPAGGCEQGKEQPAKSQMALLSFLEEISAELFV